MKKSVLSLIITLALIFTCISMPVNAADNGRIISSSIEYYDDGSYLVTIIKNENINSRASGTSGSKTCTYYGENGDKQWIYTLNANFFYDGTRSLCTYVTDSYTIYNNNWHMDSHDCSRSGDTAYGTVRMKYKFLGVTTKIVTDNIEFYCDPTGALH